MEREFLLSLLDDAIAKKDRYIVFYFGEHGSTCTVYPLIEDEDGSLTKEGSTNNGNGRF